MKLHGSHAPRGSLYVNSCCKASLPLVGKTVNMYRFCCEMWNCSLLLEKPLATCNNLICCGTGVNVGGKKRKIAFQLVLQKCCKTCCSFLWLRLYLTTREFILQHNYRPPPHARTIRELYFLPPHTRLCKNTCKGGFNAVWWRFLFIDEKSLYAQPWAIHVWEEILAFRPEHG